MKKILYLHGLDSYPSQEKLDILKSFCDELVAPFIEYRRPDLQEFLIETAKISNANVIIGSSMGGLSGYFLAKYVGCQTLLFNPALERADNYFFKLPEKINDNYHYHIILGALDDIINHQKSLEFLTKNEKENKYNYVILPNLAHRLDIETFKNEIKNFMEKIE